MNDEIALQVASTGHSSRVALEWTLSIHRHYEGCIYGQAVQFIIVFHYRTSFLNYYQDSPWALHSCSTDVPAALNIAAETPAKFIGTVVNVQYV